MHVGIDGRELQDYMTGIGRFLSEALLHFVSLRPQRKWTLFHTNDGVVASYTDYQKSGLSTHFHKYGDVCWERDGAQIEARLLLSSRPRLASPIRKRYRIYEREY